MASSMQTVPHMDRRTSNTGNRTRVFNEEELIKLYYDR